MKLVSVYIYMASGVGMGMAVSECMMDRRCHGDDVERVQCMTESAL